MAGSSASQGKSVKGSEAGSESPPRTTYSPEFKANAVRLVIDSGRSVSVVARELGLAPHLLARWKKRLQEQNGNTQSAFPGQGNIADEERRELIRLRREMAILRQEHEVLKKAVGIFSQQLR